MKVFPVAAFALHSPCWMESQRNRLWFGGHCLCILSKVLLDFRSLSYCRSDICEIFLISVHLCRQSSRISHSLMLRAWNVCQANTNCAHNGTISSPYCILKGETSHRHYCGLWFKKLLNHQSRQKSVNTSTAKRPLILHKPEDLRSGYSI